MPSPKKKLPPKRKPGPKLIHQIKITLQGIEPPIWRRFQVPADIRLSMLHGVIQDVMGWEDDHLHQFFIDGKCYGDARLADQEGVDNEDRIKLNQVIQTKGGSFIYEYDFGDSWEHRLEVEEILFAEPDARYPRCVAGERACPPEDCGGVWGYADLLDAIKDPAHPEHEERSEWLDDDFDPEEFDLDGLNEFWRERYK